MEKNFAIQESRNFYYVAKTPQEAIQYLKNYKPKEIDLAEKFVMKEKVSIALLTN